MAKVLSVLHTESSCGWGGQELRICLESILQSKQGYSLSLVCDSRSQFEARGTFIGNILSIRFSKTLRSLLDLKRCIESVAPDVLISHSSIDSWLAALAQRLWFRQLPLIRIRHVSAPVRSNFWTRWLYQSPATIVTTSEHIRNKLIDELGLNPDGVVSIPTGVDESLFSSNESLEREAEMIKAKLATKGNLFNVVMVSTLRSWKGHKYVVEALADLPNVRLLVVGDGPQELALKRLADKLGVLDRVEFFGFQPDVRPYLLASHLFIQPSYANEGVSQSLLQAAAMGLPIVASDIGGLNEVIRDRYTGILIEPKSSESIKGALQELENSLDFRHQLAAAGKTYVLENYGALKMSERMLEVMQSAVNNAITK